MDKRFRLFAFTSKVAEKQHKHGVQHTINASATSNFFGNFEAQLQNEFDSAKLLNTSKKLLLMDDVFILYQILHVPTHSAVSQSMCNPN